MDKCVVHWHILIPCGLKLIFLRKHKIYLYYNDEVLTAAINRFEFLTCLICSSFSGCYLKLNTSRMSCELVFG